MNYNIIFLTAFDSINPDNDNMLQCCDLWIGVIKCSE